MRKGFVLHRYKREFEKENVGRERKLENGNYVHLSVLYSIGIEKFQRITL